MLTIYSSGKIRLTSRDIEMFWLLDKVGYLSWTNLMNIFFGGLKGNCSRRLRKLVDLDYLREIDVPVLTKASFLKLGIEGRKTLKQMTLDVSDSPKEIIKSTFVHDEYVSDMIATFYKNGAKNFFTERELIIDDHKRAHYPDLAFVNRRDHWLFLEVEIEQKSKERIFNKVYDFVNRQEVRIVLYVSPVEPVKRYLLDLKEELTKGEKLHVVDLHEALSNPMSLERFIEMAATIDNQIISRYKCAR